VLAAALASVTGCRSCDDRSDEEQILALIEKAATLAQDHDTDGLMDLTTQWFTAEPGNRDHGEVRQVLTFAFHRYGNFRIAYPEPAIEVAPDRTTARATVPFVILREGLTLPDLGGLASDPEGWVEEASQTADPYRLRIDFAREDGEWKVDRAKIDGVRRMEGF